MTSEKPPNSRQLVRVVVLRAVAAFFVLAALLFWPAGTLRYWQAWAYLGLLFTPAFFVLIYFLRKDPRLLERRMRTKEKEPAQKTIVRLGSIIFIAAFLIPGFDRRFGWSDVATPIVLFADGIVLVGYLLFVFVVRENRYASRVIEVEPGQKLITSGPYAVVRHPMYASTLIIYVTSPLALGSFWGLAAAPGIIGILVARILNEEKVLKERLEGYPGYMENTRCRLVPFVW